MTAETARTDLQKLLDQVKHNLKSSINILTEVLQSSREFDNYREIDINKWMTQLKEFRLMLEDSSTININYDNEVRSTIRLINVSDQRTLCFSHHTSHIYEDNGGNAQMVIASSHERFHEIFGVIGLSRDGLTATDLGSFDGRSCIPGINRYSIGTHHIRFRIEHMNDHYFFFGIVTEFQKLTATICNSPSLYGWWDLGYFIMPGKLQENNKTKTIRTGDEMTLILDCVNRLIQLQHHRINTIADIPVDLRQCLFPWKIIVRMHSKDDCVRIIQ
jgi:hypothetical protein